MKIAIANISDTISAKDFSAAVRAITKQVHDHFAPAWGITATVRTMRVARGTKPDPQADVDVVLFVGELNDDPQNVQDALGYHDLSDIGIPFGFVFTDVAAKCGESWTVTLSHEVLELLADPEVNRLVVAPHPTKRGAVVLRSYEVCDPCQADTYAIDGVEVSSFVTPAYFVNAPKSTAPTNYMLDPLKPFGVRPGGYFSYFDLATNKWVDVFGSKPAERRAAAKREMRSLRRMGRHAGLGLGK